MSFTLNSHITIGLYKFKGVHDVNIKQGVHSPNNSCVIRLPISARLRQYNRLSTVSMSTAEAFTEGDKVLVKLGYNGNYATEFEGFVRRIDFSTPLAIECEGYIYQLRKKVMQPKTFVKVDYKEILRYIIAGTDIVFSEAMSNERLVVDKFIIRNDSGAEVLEQLKKHLTNVLQVMFHGNQLYMGVAYLDGNTKKGLVLQTVKYKMGWNVIRDQGLRKRIPPVDKVNFQITGIKSDGTKVKARSDNDSLNVKRIRTYCVTNQSALDYLAKLHECRETYTGYEGKIVAFGIPYCQHAWRIELSDSRYQERAGVYLADSVEVRYNRRGFRRIVGIGIKIS